MVAVTNLKALPNLVTTHILSYYFVGLSMLLASDVKYFSFFFDVSHGNFMYKIIKICISKRTLKCFIFLEEIVSYLVYLVQSEDFKLATELSEKVQYPHNRQ